VVVRSASVAMWTSWQPPWIGGLGEEHHGVWCHGRLSHGGDDELHCGLGCFAWIGFYDWGMVNSARKHCIDLG
jgi:hypothetical protein